MSLLTRNSIVSTSSLGILKVEVEDDRKGLDTTSIEASQCLDFSEGGDLDRLIQKSAAVYFVAAPKAGGSSLGIFTQECFGQSSSYVRPGDIPGLLNQLEMPKFQSFHAGEDQLTQLIKQASRNTLLIVTYREETERLASAVKHVIGWMCQRERFKELITPQIMKDNDRVSCILDEEDVVKKIIVPRKSEIDGSTLETFSCGFHESLVENLPNIVMINMRKLSNLMKLLKPKYCPDVQPKHLSSAALAQNWDYYLKIKNGTDVEINDWLVHKRNSLEYVLRLKSNMSCQGKTRQMEDQVSACPNEVIRNFYAVSN